MSIQIGDIVNYSGKDKTTEIPAGLYYVRFIEDDWGFALISENKDAELREATAVSVSQISEEAEKPDKSGFSVKYDSNAVFDHDELIVTDAIPEKYLHLVGFFSESNILALVSEISENDKISVSLAIEYALQNFSEDFLKYAGIVGVLGVLVSE